MRLHNLDFINGACDVFAQVHVGMDADTLDILETSYDVGLVTLDAEQHVL